MVNGYDTWKQMGDDLKAIAKQLESLMLNPEYQDLLTAYEIDTLHRALGHIDRFRTRAEDRMFKRLNPPPGKDHVYFNVFYGDQ